MEWHCADWPQSTGRLPIPATPRLCPAERRLRPRRPSELVVGSFADGANEDVHRGSRVYGDAHSAHREPRRHYRTQWQEYKTTSATGTQTATANSTAASPYAGLTVTYRRVRRPPTTRLRQRPRTSRAHFDQFVHQPTWTASSDDVGVVGYTLYRGVDGGWHHRRLRRERSAASAAARRTRSESTPSTLPAITPDDPSSRRPPRAATRPRRP